MYQKIVLILVYVIYSYAIVTIKPVEVDNKKNVVLELGAGYKQSGGNIDKIEITLDTMFQKHFSNFVLYLNSAYNYGEAKDIKNQNQKFIHLRGIYNTTTTNALEVFTQLQADEFKSIASRFLVGAGDRYKFYNKSSKLFLGLGAFWVDLTEQNTKSIQIVRLNSYIAYNAKINNTKINYILYAQPDIMNFNDIQLINILQFIFKIDDSLSFNININHTYDSAPADGKRTYDFVQKYAIVYKFRSKNNTKD